MIGMPGIALSLASFVEPYRYNALARLLASNLDEFIGLHGVLMSSSTQCSGCTG
jgi:hypothetical protein